MRSVWTGTLAFGMVSIPVKLGSAVSSHKIGFRQIHLADQGRVRYQKTCEIDEEVLDSAAIGRAYETPDDQLLEVTDADLNALPLPTAKTIEVSGFVEMAAVDTMQLDASYFLAPASPAANKPYVLMHEALHRAGKAAVGKFAMRGSEHLALIRARGDVLLLQTLRWPDELNPSADAAPKGRIRISESELGLADTLIDALGEADLSAYRDEYGEAVQALVTAKLEGAEPPTAGGEEGGGKVVDLMAALRASVEQAQGGGGRARRGGGRDATVTELSAKSRASTAASSGGKPADAKKTTSRASSPAPRKKAAARKTTGTATGTAADGTSGDGGAAAKKSTPRKGTAKKGAAANSGARARKAADGKPAAKKASGASRRRTG